MNFLEVVPLVRPIILFDTETTGPNPTQDRICELGLTWLHPSGEVKKWCKHINPEIPIPYEATYGNPETGYTGHGITDEMVKDAPKFRDIAAGMLKGFHDCDYGGFNIKTFDLPLLQAEFQRAGYAWSYEGAGIIDGYRIWQLGDPRTLSDAVRKFLNREHEGAHGAQSDVDASTEIIAAMLLLWPQLPRDVVSLHKMCWPVDPNSIDAEGRIIWKDGVATMNFGKKWKGLPLSKMARRDLMWIADTSDMPLDVKRICRDAAFGRMPQPPLKEVTE